MMFKVEITQENGDKYSFVAKSMSSVGSRSITIYDIQDVTALEAWEELKIPRLPIITNPGVRFTPSTR